MTDFDYKTYWNNRLTGSFGLESVGYLGLGKNFNRWMYRLRKKVFLKTVKQLEIDFSMANVMDVGSGTGFYVNLWRQLKARSVTGVDISTQAIKNLQSQFPESDFHEMDVSSQALPGERYQIISCMDVLFHVVDDNRFQLAIRNLSASLQKGGYLILSDNFLNRPEKRLPHHVSRTMEQYQSAFNNAELKIVSRRPVFYFLNFPVDTDSKFLHGIWNMLLRFIPGRELLGYFAGMALYIIDIVMLFFTKEGPTTELIVCRK